MIFNGLFNRLRQWSVWRRVVAGSLVAFVLFAAAVVVVAVLRYDRDDFGTCPTYRLPDDVMVAEAGEYALSCVAPHCNEVELYDLAIKIDNKLGSNAGFAGSWYGCVPVCVWHNDSDFAVEVDEVKFYRRVPDSVVIDRSGIVGPHRNYLFSSPWSVFGERGGARAHFASTNPLAAYLRVRVDFDEQVCYVYGGVFDNKHGEYEWEWGRLENLEATAER